MIDPAPESERRQLNSAMAVRRWFLILAAPAIFLLTLAAVAQWRVFLEWLIR